jgi:ribonuclease P protein component
MISKKNKLSRSDFEKIKENTISQKRNILGNFVIFKKDFQKWGIIVSKKNVKKAHDRNKIKRIFYNLVLSIKPNPLLFYLQNFKSIKSFKENLEKEISLLK